MSARVLESGDWPSRMSCAPAWRHLDIGPRERLADPTFEVLGIERDAHQERNRPVGVVPDRERCRSEHFPVQVQQPPGVWLPLLGLVAQDLDVHDVGIGDHDPAHLPAKLEDPRLALDHAELGFGVFEQIDQIRQVVPDLFRRLGAGHHRQAIGSEAGVVDGKADDPWLGRARGRRSLQRFQRNHPRNRINRRHRWTRRRLPRVGWCLPRSQRLGCPGAGVVPK